MTYDRKVPRRETVTDAYCSEATGSDSLVLTMDPTLCQVCSMPLGGKLTGLACSLAIESQSLSGPWQ